MNIGDVNLITGCVKINHGKGDRYRVTFINRESKRALRKYLSTRLEQEIDDPLWLNEEGRRLTISGFRHLILKYSISGNMKRYGLHDF